MDVKKRILVVDDEQINLEFFDVMLSKLGFIVEKAENGFDALEMVKRHKPDLIMLDNIMPRLSGWEVTRILKTSAEYAEFKDIPIIMFSAMDDVKDKIEGFDLGVDDYITKPYNFSEVLARIKSVLKNRELIAQVEKRESRIALVNELNKGMAEFFTGLKAPLMEIEQRAKEMKVADPEVKDFIEMVAGKAETALARLRDQDEAMSKLKAKESKLRTEEIEIKALRKEIR